MSCSGLKSSLLYSPRELAEGETDHRFHFAEPIGDSHLEPVQPIVCPDESLGDRADVASQSLGDHLEMSFELLESSIQLLVHGNDLAPQGNDLAAPPAVTSKNRLISSTVSRSMVFLSAEPSTGPISIVAAPMRGRDREK
jgi:hypothetical protein